MKKTSATLTIVSALLLQLTVATAQAAPPPASEQAPGFYRLTLGDLQITAISDGSVPQQVETLMTNTTPARIDELLARAYRETPVETSINAYLVHTGSKLLLIDTGAGDLLGPGQAGALQDNLHAAGVQGGQIDMVLLTHIHPDHIGGLTRNGRRTFPNASLHVDRDEVAYWLDAELRAAAPPALRPRFDEARAMLGPYQEAGKLVTFDGAVQLTAGVRSVEAHGHTPGHAFYEVVSRGERIVFWGDTVHAAALQLPDPAITIVYDTDAKAAAATRHAAFERAARERYLVALAHLSFPGIGQLRKEPEGYGWLPIDYSARLKP